MGTKTKAFSSPHNELTYSNVHKTSPGWWFGFYNDVYVLLGNPRNLLFGEDGCHLMINLVCELLKSLMYFSQGFWRGTRGSCFY